MEPAFGVSLEPLLQHQWQFVLSSSGYGQLRPAAMLPGAGTSTSNGTFMQPINPNYGGNGTNFFAAPSYVQGANFPAFRLRRCLESIATL